jgi:hypothetical protein
MRDWSWPSTLWNSAKPFVDGLCGWGGYNAVFDEFVTVIARYEAICITHDGCFYFVKDPENLILKNPKHRLLRASQ